MSFVFRGFVCKQGREGRILKLVRWQDHNEVQDLYFDIRPPFERAIDRQAMHLKERGAFEFWCVIEGANEAVLIALLSRMGLLTVRLSK